MLLYWIIRLIINNYTWIEYLMRKCFALNYIEYRLKSYCLNVFPCIASLFPQNTPVQSKKLNKAFKKDIGNQSFLRKKTKKSVANFYSSWNQNGVPKRTLSKSCQKHFEICLNILKESFKIRQVLPKWSLERKKYKRFC